MGLGMTREEFEVFYSYCHQYYKLRHSEKTLTSRQERKQLLENITTGANCKESSAKQYLCLYAAIVDKRPFPKNHVGKDILVMLFEKIERDFDKDVMIVAINNAYVFFQYRYKILNSYNSYARQACQEYADKYGVGRDFVNDIFSTIELEKTTDDTEIEDSIEVEENGKKEIEYQFDVDLVVAREVAPPDGIEITESKDSLVKSTDEEGAGIKGKNKKKKGDRGESIAIKIEKERLHALGRDDLILQIKHVAKKKDGYGYDIESVTIDNSGNIVPIYIEVKTTEGDITRPFFISSREAEVSKEKGDSYFIYRIFNLRENSKDVQYYIIQGNVEEKFRLISKSFIAILK